MREGPLRVSPGGTEVATPATFGATSRKLVHEAIELLPSPDRDVAWLHLVQHQALPEVARRLRMEYDQVVSALRRARETIRVRVSTQRRATVILRERP
jgi:DNA-directed RNA polymerase specialized sigma24 family protein